MHPFSNPENIRKPYGFPIFSGGRERVHWEQTGQLSKPERQGTLFRSVSNFGGFEALLTFQETGG